MSDDEWRWNIFNHFPHQARKFKGLNMNSILLMTQQHGDFNFTEQDNHNDFQFDEDIIDCT